MISLGWVVKETNLLIKSILKVFSQGKDRLRMESFQFDGEVKVYFFFTFGFLFVFLRGDFFDGNILSKLHDSWIVGAHVAK